MICICFILYANCIFLDDFKLIIYLEIPLNNFYTFALFKIIILFTSIIYIFYILIYSIISRKKIVNGRYMTEIVDSWKL